MLASLSGTITSKTSKYIILEQGGFGFRVLMASDIIARLPAVGERVKIFTYLYFRENETLELYGTETQEEIDFFELLLTVSGIGPKGALAILSIAKLDELTQAIASGDHTLLTRVSGVGRKTAQKVIIELREKLVSNAEHIDTGVAGAAADALDALVRLGYSQREARGALRAISGEHITTEEKVRAALKSLSQRK